MRQASAIAALLLTVGTIGTPALAADGSGPTEAGVAPQAEGSDAPTQDGSGVVTGEGSGEPAPPSFPVAVTLDTAPEVAVGQPLVIHVSATVPPEYTVASVQLADSPFVDVLDRRDEGATPSEVRSALTVAVFRSGTFTARAAVVVIDSSGAQHTVPSEPVTIEVASSIVNESNPEPAPSDPPMPVMTRDMRPIWAGVGLGAAALGFLVASLWRSRSRAATAQEDTGPRRPAWEVAFEALDALEAEGLLDAGRHLEFHMRLSEILRAYVGARFGFFAPEMTTTEIGRWLARREEVAGAWRDDIVDVLRDMDLVKFARFVPPRDMSEQCLASSRRLVEDLSARERELAAAAATGEAVVEGVERPPEPPPAGNAADATPTGPYTPSPASTTGAFAPRPEAPSNVVPLRPPEDRS